MPHAQIPERASLTYRADIDGLRALAVVPVVLYHFHVAPFAGGYVGVDVFFVISGFLITGLIHAEMRTGEYSLAGFYERRARRILPALFAVVLASAIAALWILFPADLKRFGESAAATALFVSNFDFWQQSGYFDASAETKPLLHTWSLAVEEQFYLAFPLLLFLFRRASRRGLLLLTGGLALASFLYGLWAVRTHPMLAFYLAPARIWELMLGAMLALGNIPRAPRWLAQVLSLGGLALLAAAVFGFSPDTPIPGENALLPCLGAALLIYANEDGGTLAARALSARPVVFVGLISYSLYLWHWPVYVFARYQTLFPLTGIETATLIGISVVLAVLSWLLVEKPFRRRNLYSQRTIFAFAGLGMAIATAAGLALLASDGIPQRFPSNVRRILTAFDDDDARQRACHNSTAAQIAHGQACIIGRKGAKPSFILWGDSHALSLIPLLSDMAATRGRSGYYIGRGGCAPLLGAHAGGEDGQRCVRTNQAALEFILAQKIRTVIVVGRWALYDLGYGIGVDARNRRPLFPDDSAMGASPDQHAEFAQALERAVARLSGAGLHVVVVADVPENEFDVPSALARMALSGQKVDIRTRYASYRSRQAGVTAVLQRLSRRYGATIVDPAPIFCASGSCEVEGGGYSLYRDNHHLTVAGAAHLAPLFEPILAQ